MQKKQLVLAAILGIILLALAGLAWILSPQVEEVYPPAGANDIPLSSEIRVKFNRGIRFDPKIEYLVIDPPIPGEYSMDGNTLIFTPSLTYQNNQAITVKLQQGIQSSIGLPIFSTMSWSFQVKHAWLLYLLNNGESTELYQIDPQGLQTSKVVETPLKILDYSVSPDGSAILYASQTGKDTQIYWLNLETNISTLIHTCFAQICSQPEVSQDLKYLSFVSGSSPQDVNPESSRVWILTLSGLKEIGNPLSVTDNHPTRDPAWSALGWLSYYDDEEQAYIFYNPSNGKRGKQAHDTGELGSWSPDGTIFLYPQIYIPAEGTTPNAKYSSQIVGYEPETGNQILLTRNNIVEDVLPTYSPDGKWVAFARRYVTPERWTPGRQLWLVRSDGNNPRPMTSNENETHLEIAWSPDSTQIAYIRFNTALYNQNREVWIMDVKKGLAQKILVNAYRLQWRP